MKLLNPVHDENLELHDVELECHRDLLNSVPERNLEDLDAQPTHHNHEELECPRSATQAHAKKTQIRS